MRKAIHTLLILCLLLVAPAVTAEPTAAEIAVARRLYGEAVQLEEAGKWAEAEKKLREAIAIKETPGLRFHLAVSQEKQGKLVEALVDFDRAQEMIDRGTRAPDVEQLLGPARDAVRARVPTLTVEAPADASSPTLSIDGKAMVSTLFGKPVPLNPGKHVVRVTAAGFVPSETEIILAESEKKSLEPELSKAAPAATGAGMGLESSSEFDAGADEPSSSGSSARTAVLIGGAAVTVVGLATGVGFLIYKNDRNEQARAAGESVDERSTATGETCADATVPELKKDCAALNDFLDQRDSAKTLSTIGFVTAGIGAVATVATYFLWQPEPSRSTARIGAAPLPGGGGMLGVSGSF